MSPDNRIQSNQADSPVHDSLAMVAIALDRETAAQLRPLLVQIPAARVNAEFDNYLAGDQDVILIDRLRSSGTDVFLIDFDRDRDQALRTVQKVREVIRDADVFAVSSSADSQQIIGSMRAGCNEYLTKPLRGTELSDALTRVMARRKEKKDIASGQLLAFIGVKGGSGVTALSIHLAMLLAQGRPQHVLLVDLHRYLGDVALYLALASHRYHFFDLVENASRLDAELLRGYRAQHASGVDVLTAPDSFEAAHAIVHERVQPTLEFLQLQYRYVIVDCAPGLTDQSMEVVDLADHVYLVAQPEVPSLRNAVRYLDYLSARHYPEGKVQVVINRFDKRSPINEAEIERAIHTKVAWKIPNDYREVTKTVNTGSPLSVESRSDFIQSMRAWANSLAGGALQPTKKEGKGMLSILRI
jgi:pilus assembly protein CpaE